MKIEIEPNLLDGGKRKRDLVLMTFVVVNCLRRSIFEEPGNSMIDPGTGNKLNGRFESKK